MPVAATVIKKESTIPGEDFACAQVKRVKPTSKGLNQRQESKNEHIFSLENFVLITYQYKKRIGEKDRGLYLQRIELCRKYIC